MYEFFHNGSTTFNFLSDLKYSSVAWHGGEHLQPQDCKFKVSLGYMRRPTNQQTNKQTCEIQQSFCPAWWLTPVIQILKGHGRQANLKFEASLCHIITL